MKFKNPGVLLPILLIAIFYFLKNDVLVGDSIPVYSKIEDYPHDKETEKFIRYGESIRVADGSQIHAWVYLPKSATKEDPVPVVILSHGCGSQKEMGLDYYASLFASNSMGAVVIDYLSFGESTVQKNIRNYINVWNHIDDLKRTVDYVSSGQLGNLFDADRVATWGSSLAGGYGIFVSCPLFCK